MKEKGEKAATRFFWTTAAWRWLDRRERRQLYVRSASWSGVGVYYHTTESGPAGSGNAARTGPCQ
jgi:hypothetical protein